MRARDSQMYTMVGGTEPAAEPTTSCPTTPQAYFELVRQGLRRGPGLLPGTTPDRLSSSTLADRAPRLYLSTLGATARPWARRWRPRPPCNDYGFRGQGSPMSPATSLSCSAPRSTTSSPPGHDRSAVLAVTRRTSSKTTATGDVYYFTPCPGRTYGGAASTAAPGRPARARHQGLGASSSARADLEGETLSQIETTTPRVQVGRGGQAQLSASDEFLKDKLAAARQDPARR